MSSIRFGRGAYYQFFRREDVRTRWDYHSAVQFLNGFRSDEALMATLRRHALAKGTAFSQSKVSDEQVIQILARLLVSGELLVALPHRERYPDTQLPETPVAAPPAPKEKKEKAPIVDEPTFEPEHDGVAQAGVLIAAAKAGMPFCEECARAAAEAQASPAAPARQAAPPEKPKAKPAPAQAPAPVPEPEPEPDPVAAAPAPAPVERNPTFNKNLDAEAQAAVLKAAAEDGTPFCEECERAAAALQETSA